MKVLIIGGTGLIGPSVMQELYAAFKNVQISTITRSGKSLFTEQSFKANRSDESQMAKILTEATPDILIDMIPFTAQDTTTTAKQILQTMPDLPVIAISSIDVYAAYAKLHRTEDINYQPCPITEDMALRQTLGAEGDKYDKLNVERIYQQTLKNVTIVRLPATYGWPDTSRIASHLDPMLAGEKSISMPKTLANWKFSRCLNKNAAHAIFKVVEANQKGHHTYNVAEKTPHTEQGWCQKIAHLCGWNGQIILSDDPGNAPDFKQDLYVSTKKIRTELSFSEKYDPDHGLADTIKLYAEKRFPTDYKQSY